MKRFVILLFLPIVLVAFTLLYSCSKETTKEYNHDLVNCTRVQNHLKGEPVKNIDVILDVCDCCECHTASCPCCGPA